MTKVRLYIFKIRPLYRFRKLCWNFEISWTLEWTNSSSLKILLNLSILWIWWNFNNFKSAFRFDNFEEFYQNYFANLITFCNFGAMVPFVNFFIFETYVKLAKILRIRRIPIFLTHVGYLMRFENCRTLIKFFNL